MFMKCDENIWEITYSGINWGNSGHSEHLLEKLKPISEVFVEELN